MQLFPARTLTTLIHFRWPRTLSGRILPPPSDETRVQFAIDLVSEKLKQTSISYSEIDILAEALVMTFWDVLQQEASVPASPPAGQIPSFASADSLLAPGAARQEEAFQFLTSPTGSASWLLVRLRLAREEPEAGSIGVANHDACVPSNPH